jgi:serine/threonine protein kinase
MSALIDKKRLKAGEYIIKCKEKITQNDKKHIIYEYCSENSLREFSKNGRRLTIKNIYEIAYQLIQVMKLIHFDLIKTED